MSFIRKLFERLRRPSTTQQSRELGDVDVHFGLDTYLVGKDLEGNKYYEYPSVLEETPRTKRVVKYRAGADMLTYVAGKRRLPVQWSAWLTHTRPHPPSLEELHADIERQRRVLQNAALIEARDREERALQLRMAPDNREAITEGVVNTPAVEAASQEAAASPAQPAGHSDPFVISEKASQQAPPANVGYQTPMSDEPQTWTPRAIRRG